MKMVHNGGWKGIESVMHT